VALRRGSFGFLVDSLAGCFVLSLHPLSFGRTPTINRSRFTIGTRVIEIISRRIVNLARIVAFYMLPTIAFLTINRVAIIVGVVADTLDREILFGDGLDDGRRIARMDRSGWVEGRMYRGRALRCDRERPFCHNLARASTWL